MHHAAAKVKGELPYSGIGAEAEGKRVGAATGEKLDQAVSTTSSPQFLDSSTDHVPRN